MIHLLNKLSPCRCLLCHKAVLRNYDLCCACEQALPYCDTACKQCGAWLAEPGECGECIKASPQFIQAVAVCWYQSDVKRLVGALKYRHQLAASRIIAGLMSRRLMTVLDRSAYPDVVVPVPLHQKRLSSRGFNQSLLLAKGVAKSLQLPLAKGMIQRVIDTAPQVRLTEAQRRKNVRNAFECGPLANPPHILLVDDVMTTGATLNAIAKIYPGRASVAVFARA